MALMQDPNYIVTALPDYVKNNEDLLVKDVVFGAPTVKRLVPQTGIKTSAHLNYLDVDVTFQNGNGCGFNPVGSATLSDRDIVTGLIKVDMEICPDKLLGKYPEYLVRIPETERASLPFEEYLLRAIIRDIQDKLEVAVWQGDTTSANANLNRFDGFIKILDADTAVITVAIANNASAYDAIKAVILALPGYVYDKRDAEVHVSPELYRNFIFDLVEKNFYHYSGPQDEAPAEFLFPGTSVKVVLTPGLAGTSKIVAGRASNFYYGTDAENNEEKVKVVYDEKEETFFVKSRWNSGVQVAFPDEVVVGTIAAAAASTTTGDNAGGENAGGENAGGDNAGGDNAGGDNAGGE